MLMVWEKKQLPINRLMLIFSPVLTLDENLPVPL